MFDLIRPHHVIRSLHDLDCTALLERGIHGVLLDLDSTLIPWRHPVAPQHVETWVNGLVETGLRACLVTNARTVQRVAPIAEQLGLPWVINAAKPLATGFRRAMNVLGTTPSSTAMIGDQVFTDVLGANRLGLFTVLVEPMAPAHEMWPAKLFLRPLERLVGRCAKNGEYAG